MFLFHIAFALGLLSITGGVFLCVWAKNVESTIAKLFGLLITVFALFSTICSGYYQAMMWQSGIYQNMMSMQQSMMKEKGSMSDNKSANETSKSKHHKSE